MDQKIQLLDQQFSDRIIKDQTFANLTTLEIGGPIGALFEAKLEQELMEVVSFAKENDIPYLVIGSGSNLLVSNEGFEGLVIKVETDGIKEEGNDLLVRSGTLLQTLVDHTIFNGLGGMNKMSGIPGTVGGAVYGKAGAYGHNISDYLAEVAVFDPAPSGASEGKVVHFTKEECEFGYRDSIFKKNKLLILEIRFANLPKADSKQLVVESQEIIQKRTAKYPPHTKCPGSFFKNIVADELDKKTLAKVKDYVTEFGKIPAGRLIEAAGGKGDQLGQIKITENHGNTFVNLGDGTAKDFYALAKKYHDKVKEKFDLDLEPEVQLINLPPFH